MKMKVTDQGVLIPKELLAGMDEVHVHKQDGMIIIAPAYDEDPTFRLGENPVTADVTDASENHDHYLYGAPPS